MVNNEDGCAFRCVRWTHTVHGHRLDQRVRDPFRRGAAAVHVGHPDGDPAVHGARRRRRHQRR